MNRMMTGCIIFLAAMTALFRPVCAVAGGDFDFAVIQPGQPGSPEEARPVMDALGCYIQKKLGLDRTPTGKYFNRVDPALGFLHNKRPAWGILSLAFYAGHAHELDMTPVAGTRPGGHDKDLWRLVGSSRVPVTDWKRLKGEVLGTMLFERQAAACLLFGIPADRLPFTLQGTFHPLRSLRKVIRGAAGAAVLDRVQYASVQSLSLAREVTTIHMSRELPTSPAVWFGTPGVRTRELTGILLQMKGDRDAQHLLRMLQTDGFVPADPDLGRCRLGHEGTDCVP
ncbi:MAG: hypothetical protein J7M32_10600 [Deltaproteobacteria bacterium]|nr:hypothetical protein [Deltaproteobacteria bacterium]